jgi:hypothetical protein
MEKVGRGPKARAHLLGPLGSRIVGTGAREAPGGACRAPRRHVRHERAKNTRIVNLFFLDLSAGSPGFLRRQLVNGTHQVVRDFHEGLTGMFGGAFACGHSLLFSPGLVVGNYYSRKVTVVRLSWQTSVLPPVSMFTGPVFSAIEYQRSHSLLELGHLLLDLREGCFVPPGLN